MRPRLAASVPDTVRVIVDLAVLGRFFYQAVDIGLETWTLGVEFARKLEVIDNLPVENLARDQQRNAGRVRRHQTDCNAVFKVVNLNPFGFTQGNVSEGVTGFHGRR